jgi:ATP/maltotriose-dependent transcriptional regulator MalT
VVVFDNYQEVPRDAPLHKLVREALECLPAGINVLVLSRGDPPSALAPLRVSGAMTLLGAEELRLTARECAEIARVRNVAIKKPALQQLFERTLGWTAGVVLALEQKGTSWSAALLPPLATSQVVFDYFAGEIFGRRDPETQALLMRAALLPSMAAHRVVELTGAAPADRFLEELARGNYFTVKLAQARGAPAVYQFHPMFREFRRCRTSERGTTDKNRLRPSLGPYKGPGSTSAATAPGHRLRWFRRFSARSGRSGRMKSRERSSSASRASCVEAAANARYLIQPMAVGSHSEICGKASTSAIPTICTAMNGITPR